LAGCSAPSGQHKERGAGVVVFGSHAGK
jgi:hypothetical protein